MPSRLILHRKFIERDGSIVEMKVWGLPRSEKYPEGYKYSLYWIKAGQVLLGYDNHHPKGHHRHYGKREEIYKFTTLEKLVQDFQEDRRRIANES